LMKLVMKNLGLEIPTFILKRQLVVLTSSETFKMKVKLFGVDVDGTPVTFIKAVELPKKKKSETIEPNLDIFAFKTSKKKKSIDVVLHFYGHYNEPSLNITLSTKPNSSSTYTLLYNPLTGVWKVVSPESQTESAESKSEVENEMKNLKLEEEEEDKQASQSKSEKEEEKTEKPKEEKKHTMNPDACSIVIGNTHTKLVVDEEKSRNAHKWTVFVRPQNNDDDISSLIEKVKFDLHPTFFPSVVTVDTTPFEISRTGWGTFDVDVKVFLKNGVVKDFVHNLSFEDGGSQNVYELGDKIEKTNGTSS